MLNALENASQFPKVFYCRHMQPGIVGYEDGVVLCDTDALKRIIGTAKTRAIPVYIGHQDVDLKNIKQQADGYVTESFYNSADGWAWFKFIAIDDKMHEAINKGWSVSNAYTVTEWGPGGTKNNCPYKREVRNGEFTHLAIVPDPRYEGAEIFTPDQFKTYQEQAGKKLDQLHNSKGSKTMKFFKTTKQEVPAADIDMDTEVELKNGKTISIGAMVEAVEKAQKQEAQLVEVGGKKVSLAQLINSFSELENRKKKMKNGESEADEDMEEEVVEGDQDEEGDDEIGKDKMKNKKKMKNKRKNMKEEDDCMANDADEDEQDIEEENKKKNKKKSMKNSKGGDDTQEVEVDDKFFEELRNANLRPLAERNPVPDQLIETSQSQLARGQARYGSGNK